MSGIVLGLVALIVYGAAAVVAFGWITRGGQYIMRSDWAWVAVWPLLPVRPLMWRVRLWWKHHGPVRRVEWGATKRWQFVGVPARRIDRWLIRLGEELSCRWASVLERRTKRKSAREASRVLATVNFDEIHECPLCPPVGSES